MQDHKYSKQQLMDILNEVVGKTLGEVDSAHVFDRTKNNPKITGIAGDVIENSVLGYPSDSYQSPDLNVDGMNVELKTTGIRKSKKDPSTFEAKEPMSITAVSPETITNETFETSHFWQKLERLLLVYYHYNSYQTVNASDYANFKIEGYELHEFSEKDKETLRNDWLIIREFIQKLKIEYGNSGTEVESQYPRLSSELRSRLMMIDTAPKWPNRPRFRLKRVTVSSMVQEHFGNKLAALQKSYSSYSALDQQLHQFTEKYRGMTVQELMNLFDLPISLNHKTNDVSKSVTEQIVIKMFGANAKKLNKIEDFNKLGLIAKTVTQTIEGKRTEDIKFLPIDFNEFTNQNVSFETSSINNYFSERQFLCILFEEPNMEAKLLENKFLGFKRIIFSNQFIDTTVRNTWNKIRTLITSNLLVDIISYDKNGNPIVNKGTGMVKSAPNFPKSKDGEIFVRGSGVDSSKKTLTINGIRMYQQYLWIKGSAFLSLLNETDFI